MLRLLLLSLMLFTSACSFAPDYVRPEMELPNKWTEAQETHMLEKMWWKRFGDETLNKLIDEALTNNKSIDKAMATVDIARAKLGLARGAYFPVPNAAASATRAGSDPSYGSFKANIGAAWEIDLWGKYRNLTDSARAQLFSSEAALDAVLLSITGQTATAYFNLLAYDRQEEIAIQTVTTREEDLKIYNARYAQGLISELDLLRSKTELEAARSTLFQVRYSKESSEAALSALVGRSPREIYEGNIERGLSLKKLKYDAIIPAGLPSEMLTNRPDIRQVEQLLIAANYEIGAARAAYFPSISLTGLLGVTSPDLSDLFSSGVKAWSIGGALNLPLDIWNIRSQELVTEAAKQELIADYELTVQNAFREMRDALSQQEQYNNLVKSMETMVTELRKAVELARARYDNGYSSYLEVLDAERSLLSSEIELQTARSMQLSGVVNVCIALGGGTLSTVDN